MALPDSVQQRLQTFLDDPRAAFVRFERSEVGYRNEPTSVALVTFCDEHGLDCVRNGFDDSVRVSRPQRREQLSLEI